MTLQQLVWTAEFLHREARLKDGDRYNRAAVNADIAARCRDHDIDYDKVIDRLTATAYRTHLTGV